MLWEDFLSQHPKALDCLRLARIGLDFFQSAKNACDIAVQNWGPAIECDGGDGARGVTADAGKGGQFVHAAGDPAAEISQNPLGGGVEIAGAGIIAQALPKAQNIMLRSHRQRGQVGKGFHKPAEVIRHGCHLGLLQHKLTDEHGIRFDGP